MVPFRSSLFSGGQTRPPNFIACRGLTVFFVYYVSGSCVRMPPDHVRLPEDELWEDDLRRSFDSTSLPFTEGMAAKLKGEYVIFVVTRFIIISVEDGGVALGVWREAQAL